MAASTAVPQFSDDERASFQLDMSGPEFSGGAGSVAELMARRMQRDTAAGMHVSAVHMPQELEPTPADEVTDEDKAVLRGMYDNIDPILNDVKRLYEAFPPDERLERFAYVWADIQKLYPLQFEAFGTAMRCLCNPNLRERLQSRKEMSSLLRTRIAIWDGEMTEAEGRLHFEEFTQAKLDADWQRRLQAGIDLTGGAWEDMEKLK